MSVSFDAKLSIHRADGATAQDVSQGSAAAISNTQIVRGPANSRHVIPGATLVSFRFETNKLPSAADSLAISQAQDAEMKWNGYLQRLTATNENGVNETVVKNIELVRRAVHQILKSKLLPPQAAAGEDGGIQLVWRDNPHYLTIDVLPSGKVHWFYKNKETKHYDGEENLDHDIFPPQKLLFLMDIWRDQISLARR